MIIVFIVIVVLIFLNVIALSSSRRLKTKLNKTSKKTTGMTRGPMRRFQGNCHEATQR